MPVKQQHLTFTTTGHGAMRDLTPEVERIVKQSGITSGLVNVFVVGSTAAVGTMEFEPGLQKDLPQQLDKISPPSRDYGHEKTWQDGNGHSHLQATLQGPSVTIPFTEGKPILGTWQQIFCLECDTRSRERTIIVTVMGE